MDSSTRTIFKESVVIGAGISGIAVAKWLKHYNKDFMVLEKSNDIAGLWRFREDDYGVMEFTHINVSKYNYCYSDHPFPSENVDFPHHSDMYKYVKSYVEKNDLFKSIKFNHEVLEVNEIKSNDLVEQFTSLDLNKKIWKVQVKDLESGEVFVVLAHYLSIASGHHGVPLEVKFPGQETFTGDIFHSVRFKSATFNKLTGKRVLVVGIGNSAVDILTNLYNEGRCKKVVCSTRSGAWIIPNYINGYATDLYACRTFLQIPWNIGSSIMEMIIKFIYGSPEKYNLNPKMRALAAQPTVSPTLIHHLQRNYIHIKPNIQSIAGSEVTFENGEVDTFDTIIMCTGYKIGLEFLHPDVRNMVFKDSKSSVLNLFKQVFHPEIGTSLGFIGFAQPTSGGLLTISEIQARWFVHLMNNTISLPSKDVMNESISKDLETSKKRFHNSARHTIQQDPILYNDEVSSFYGAKPSFLKNIPVLWRLLFSSCGPAQWRLNGPEAYSDATTVVKSVPTTFLMNTLGYALLMIVAILSLFILFNPLIFVSFAALGVALFYSYKKFN